MRLMIRLLDILFSFLGIVLLLPVFVGISLSVMLTDGLPVFYVQSRVGKAGKDFRLFKFRTMRTGSDRSGQLTVGGRDPRLTRLGFVLRRYKLDELPQLVNVLAGSMSLVGPRPEVRRYVELYTEDQRRILSVRPGITDEASIVFANENELLGDQADPEKFYRETVLPEKIRLNLRYIENRGIGSYFSIIWRTIVRVVRGR
ncbi:MAG: putative undecaprenyl-phosphate N-acetylgalactosaminyl 1-phosphate transferase [Bacteroidota bacterium]|jgi:lipopolysaccharide/colanic/teichoic acid biosynthesis glycosyltransferase